MAGNETFVACDFSNTAKYSMMMADATARTLIGIDDPNAFGDGGSGTADVAGAVLRWSDDVDLGNAIQLVDGAEATIDTQQYDASVGAIGGTGDLLKTGAGTLTLAENSTFTGDTILAEGGLVINAQYASDITVEGGTLGGSGTLADVAVTGGRIAPGNSIGTMTLDGAFTLNGGTLEVEIDDSGAADKIIADSAELTSGTVCVVPLEPITDKRDYTIIETTDGVTGDPDDLGKEISDRSYLLDFSLGVVDNDLILTATQVESFANLSASSTNPNAGHVASVLDGAVTNGLGGSQMAALQMMNAPQLTQTVEQLSPQVHQGSSQAIGRQAGAIRQSTLGRINTVQYASRQSEKGLWDYALATAGTDAMGPASQGAWPFPEMMEDDWVGFARSLNDWGEVDGDQYANGYRWRTHGMDLGAETLVDSDKLVGFSITPLWTGVTGADSSGTADVVSLFGNLYGSWFHDTWHIDAGTFYGHAWTDTHRPISALGLQAEGDYESDIFSLFLGGGLVWNRKEYEIEPFVVWDYTSRADGGYSESGAGSLNLDIHRNHTDSLRHLLGIRVSKMSKATKGARIRSYASAAWEHEYLQDQIIGDVDLLGQTFSSFGHKIDRDSGLFSAGVDWRARDNVSVFADYTATINRDLTSHNVNAGLRILF
jgi:outer membrane autotransporter protein